MVKMYTLPNDRDVYTCGKEKNIIQQH